MKLLEEILASVREDKPVEEVYVCAFDTAVRTKRWGLSSTFRDACGVRGGAWVTGCGTLLGKSALGGDLNIEIHPGPLHRFSIDFEFEGIGLVVAR